MAATQVLIPADAWGIQNYDASSSTQHAGPLAALLHRVPLAVIPHMQAAPTAHQPAPWRLNTLCGKRQPWFCDQQALPCADALSVPPPPTHAWHAAVQLQPACSLQLAQQLLPIPGVHRQGVVRHCYQQLISSLSLSASPPATLHQNAAPDDA